MEVRSHLEGLFRSDDDPALATSPLYGGLWAVDLRANSIQAKSPSLTSTRVPFGECFDDPSLLLPCEATLPALTQWLRGVQNCLTVLYCTISSSSLPCLVLTRGHA